MYRKTDCKTRERERNEERAAEEQQQPASYGQVHEEVRLEEKRC